MYYIPYCGKCKSNWKVVIKTKPRDQVEVEEVFREAYQVNDLIFSRVAIDIDIPSSLHAALGEVDMVELFNQWLVRKIDGTERDSNIDDEEDKFVDDVELENDEDSPQLLD